MTMEKGIRKQLLNMIISKYEEKPKFKRVIDGLPNAQTFPNANNLPEVYIGLSPSPLAPLTNQHYETDFGIEVIGALLESKNLSTALVDLQDDLEEILFSLMLDSTFQSLATLIKVNQADPSPLSLAPLGYRNPILPPFGVLRISAAINLRYLAF